MPGPIGERWLEMTIRTVRRTSLRWTTRAGCALAVLAGVVAMHALPGNTTMSSDQGVATPLSMTVMSRPAMHHVDTMLTAVAAPMAGMACGHDHCLATLRSAAQITTHGQVASLSRPQVASASVPALLELASERAPPQQVCLNVLCVSRT